METNLAIRVAPDETDRKSCGATRHALPCYGFRRIGHGMCDALARSKLPFGVSLQQDSVDDSFLPQKSTASVLR
jgi:hypothetical protein